MVARTALFALVVLGASVARGSILPDDIGQYSHRNISPAPIPPGDRELYEEYGLRAAERSVYTDREGRTMTVELLRFRSSEGGHAAYLWLRPARAVASPLAKSVSRSEYLTEVHTAIAGRMTIAGWKNYVFRFFDAAPSTSQFEKVLQGLPDVDPTEPSSDTCGNYFGCPYFDVSSERALLGPVSLSRFAVRVPPSVAAFRIGAVGRVARFETPAGPITRIIFQYPTAVGQSLSSSFCALPGARVEVAGRRVGLIFDPADTSIAKDLLDAVNVGSEGAGWEPRNLSDKDLTLDDGMAMVFVAFALGGTIALIRRLMRSRDIQNPTTSLHLGKDQA